LFSNYAVIQEPAYSQEDVTTSPSTTSTTKNTNNNNDDGSFLLIMIIIGIIYLLYREYTQRYGKHRVRRSFPQSVREVNFRLPRGGTEKVDSHKTPPKFFDSFYTYFKRFRSAIEESLR
jgi:hypothetical protein